MPRTIITLRGLLEEFNPFFPVALRFSLLKLRIPSFCHITICMKLRFNGGTTHFYIETRWRVWSSGAFRFFLPAQNNAHIYNFSHHRSWEAIRRLWPTISAAMVCCLLLDDQPQARRHVIRTFIRRPFVTQKHSSAPVHGPRSALSTSPASLRS